MKYTLEEPSSGLFVMGFMDGPPLCIHGIQIIIKSGMASASCSQFHLHANPADI